MNETTQAYFPQARGTAEAVVRDHALELFDFSLRPQGGKLAVTVVLDKTTGPVTLEECARVSRELESRLDALDLIQVPYLLEVSSPGLDRPLRNLDDCLRFTGRLAHLVTVEPVEGQSSFRGRLGRVEGGSVELAQEGGRTVLLDFSKVKQARLEVEF